MNNQITVQIDAPTTEWCRSCGAEFHYSRYSMRCKCQNCGEEKMSHGIKPEHSDVVICYKAEGRYNLLSNETQFQYFFVNLPTDRKRMGFVVDEDLDVEDPFALADELNAIYERYLYSSDKKEIKNLAEVVFNDNFRESQYKKQTDNKRKELMAELYWIEKSRGEL